MNLAFRYHGLVTSEDTMRQGYLAILIISLGFSVALSAGGSDKGAVIGGAIGVESAEALAQRSVAPVVR